jgi:hypothetical protein
MKCDLCIWVSRCTQSRDEFYGLETLSLVFAGLRVCYRDVATLTYFYLMKSIYNEKVTALDRAIDCFVDAVENK